MRRWLMEHAGLVFAVCYVLAAIIWYLVEGR